ncbi:MAG: hypothetical protein H6Q86_3854 [candidate division NC10 bacterium]|nr:hypothetical protein [candidate division NC10 bacterium]
MAAVERPSIAGEERAHHPRQGATPRAHQEMGVIGEQGPRVHAEPGGRHERGQAAHEVGAIRVMHHHMVEDARGVQAGLAWHRDRRLQQIE